MIRVEDDVLSDEEHVSHVAPNLSGEELQLIQKLASSSSFIVQDSNDNHERETQQEYSIDQHLLSVPLDMSGMDMERTDFSSLYVDEKDEHEQREDGEGEGEEEEVDLSVRSIEEAHQMMQNYFQTQHVIHTVDLSTVSQKHGKLQQSLPSKRMILVLAVVCLVLLIVLSVWGAKMLPHHKDSHEIVVTFWAGVVLECFVTFVALWASMKRIRVLRALKISQQQLEASFVQHRAAQDVLNAWCVSREFHRENSSTTIR